MLFHMKTRVFSNILSVLVGEIVFFYPDFFASGNHYRNLEETFKEKFFTPSRNCFSGQWKTVFFIFQRFLTVKTISPSSRNVFLTNSSIRLLKMDFLSSGKSIFLFRTFLKLLKLGGCQFLLLETDFLAVRYFFSFLRYSF